MKGNGFMVSGAKSDSHPLPGAGVRANDGAASNVVLSVHRYASPVGEFLVSVAPQGIRAIHFGHLQAEAAGTGDAVPDDTDPQVTQSAVAAAQVVWDEFRRQADEYFAGTRRDWDLMVFPAWAVRPFRTISAQLLTAVTEPGFRHRALAAMMEISLGGTVSYLELAAAAGNPKAARAAGTACATNTLPLIIPCHRVLPADGSIGNYAGGPELKAALLAHERTVVAQG